MATASKQYRATIARAPNSMSALGVSNSNAASPLTTAQGFYLKPSTVPVQSRVM